MKLPTFALCLFTGLSGGCATIATAAPLPVSALPDCFGSNFDAGRNLFTVHSAAGHAASQQCVLRVLGRGSIGSIGSNASIADGHYALYLANGGGGGAGETRAGRNLPPERGRFGSGRGGGEGRALVCGPGAPGGNGYGISRAI